MTGNILNAIRQLYSHVECAVRVNGHVTPWFKVDSGVKQGVFCPRCSLICLAMT